MIPDIRKFVNVKLPDQAMNEVTLRSILTFHGLRISWRDLHKFAIIFKNTSTSRAYATTLPKQDRECCKTSNKTVNASIN